MNSKKLIALVALAAFGAFMAPSLPASAALTGSVLVKWNTQSIGSILLFTQYSTGTTPAGQHGAAAGTILAKDNGVGGICQATDASANGTVNYGNITPSSAEMNCMETNAINAQVVTNDTSANGWMVTEATSAAVPAGYELCAYANQVSGAFPFSGASLPATLTSRVAAVTNTTSASCASSGQALSMTAFDVVGTGAGPSGGDTSAFSAASPANMGEDLEIVFDPTAPAGASPVGFSAVYTLILN